MNHSPLQAINTLTDNLPDMSIWLTEKIPHSDTYQVLASSGFGPDSPWQSGRLIHGESALAMTTLMSRGTVIFDEENTFEHDLVIQLMPEMQIKSGISIPINDKDGREQGMLAIICDELRQFTPMEINLIKMITKVISEPLSQSSVACATNRKTRDIVNAKNEWELTVDSLPQLIIALDVNATIIRANRTAEEWGIISVNMAKGMNVVEFLKQFRSGQSDNCWSEDWDHIWQQLAVQKSVDCSIENACMGRVFQYSLRRIVGRRNESGEQCYAVLTIDDITHRHNNETTMKDHICKLEQAVVERNKQLEVANRQLQHELLSHKCDKVELLESRNRLQKTSSQLMDMQETERKRIAAELHDSVGQSLGAVKFKLEGMVGSLGSSLNEAMHVQFSDVVLNLKELINEVRRIAMDLRPSMLDDLGVLMTLNWFFREFEKTYASITIFKSVSVDEKDISKEQKVAIFRIVQEALNNVVKHAAATRIWVDLKKQDDGIFLCIRDNGQGFDMHQIMGRYEQRGFGLNSMIERSDAIGGRLEIESGCGEGTCLKMVCGNLNQTEY